MLKIGPFCKRKIWRKLKEHFERQKEIVVRRYANLRGNVARIYVENLGKLENSKGM